jgi:DNA-binding transcriptional LysR family regulator
LIYRFKKDHPNIRVDVIRHNSLALINEVRDDLADLAFVSFFPDDADIDAAAVMTDPLVLIAAPQHPFSLRSRVRFQELGSESFLAHNVSSPSRVRVIEAFHDSATPLHISMEISSVETIKRLVAMGSGIAFVPAMCVRKEVEQGDLAQISVDGFSYERTLWLIRRRMRTHSDASRAFMKLIAAIKGHPGSLGDHRTQETY